MADFLIADTHFGHQFVAGLRGYTSTEEHDRAVLAAVAKHVGPGDDLWVLGDLAFGEARGGASVQELVKVAGRTHLVLGNHDRAHPAYPNGHLHLDEFAAFDSVQAFGCLRRDGLRLMLSHFPYTGDHTDTDRFDQWRLVDLGQPLIHGHTHSSERVSFSADGTIQVCVGWEAWRRPVSVGEVVSTIREARAAR